MFLLKLLRLVPHRLLLRGAQLLLPLAADPHRRGRVPERGERVPVGGRAEGR